MSRFSRLRRLVRTPAAGPLPCAENSWQQMQLPDCQSSAIVAPSRRFFCRSRRRPTHQGEAKQRPLPFDGFRFLVEFSSFRVLFLILVTFRIRPQFYFYPLTRALRALPDVPPTVIKNCWENDRPSAVVPGPGSRSNLTSKATAGFLGSVSSGRGRY